MPAALERGKAAIAKSTARLVEKGSLTPDQKAKAEAIQFVGNLDSAASADLMIEAATENPDLKFKIFRDLDAASRPEVILASNTSSISITKIAAQTKRPDKVIGMHFMNPVPLMSLVEVIRGLGTSGETMQTVLDLCKSMGKLPVEASDSPGFISNRILCPMINEAIFVLQEGLATPEEIDAGMKLGANHPIGPLALADLVGLDTLLAVLNVFYADFRDPKYRAAPLLIEMVDAGYLGRKSGRGFYKYS
jgi:3-hydroxybutyryl-CoA dehydrogenase